MAPSGAARADPVAAGHGRARGRGRLIAAVAGLTGGTRLSLWDYPDKSLLMVDLESGDSSQVDLPGNCDWLYDTEWSPSGSLLAYVTMSEPDHYALRIAERDGSGARTILEDSAPIGSPRWAPGEHALYYLSGGTELRKVKLTRSRGSAAAAPLTLLDGMQAGPSEVPGVMAPFTLTADARRLVYLKSLEYSNLWELTGDSSIADGAFTTRRLTTGTALRRGVALSPDRRWVAYLETSNEGTDLFRTALDGGRAQRLTRGGRVASRRPAWSPDGSRLAYGTRDGGVVRLAMLRVEGGGERVFGETSLPAMGDVAWGPSHRILHQVAGNRNFRLLDPVTGEQEWLVPPDAPGWSEDGRSVLAVDWDAGHLLGIGLDGRLESLGQLPFRDPDCAAVNASAPRRLVCVVPEQISDVWMVAGFDPEAGGD